MTSNTFSPWARLDAHITAHVYKRGQFKGDAPFDPHRRARSHHRVRKAGDNIAIRLHNTDIITVTPDNNLILDCAGWSDSITTREALNAGLARCGVPAYIATRHVFGMLQLCYTHRYRGDSVLYYDGMEIDATGKVVSPLRTFERKRLDRNQTKELMDDVKGSGFKDMFKLLHATCTMEHLREGSGVATDKAIRSEIHANQWPRIIASHTIERRWDYVNGGVREVARRPAANVWASIMAECKKHMYETVKTDVTSV